MGLAGDQAGPVVVASRRHRAGGGVAQVAQYQYVLHAGHLAQRFVQHRLHDAGRAAPPGAVHRQHCLGFAIVQAGHDGLRPEARKQGHQHGANFQYGKEGDEGLRQVGQVQADPVALADVQRLQGPGQAADFGIKLAVAQGLAVFRVFTLPDQEGLLPHRRAAVPVQAVEHDVGGAADAPACPLDAARGVEHLGVGFIKSHVAEVEHLLHQPGRVGIGTGTQTLEAGFANLAQKGGQVGRRHQFRGGYPVKRSFGRIHAPIVAERRDGVQCRGTRASFFLRNQAQSEGRYIHACRRSNPQPQIG